MKHKRMKSRARPMDAFVFDCQRTLIRGRQVRSKINQKVDSNTKDKVYTFHTLVQRGKWWSPDLWLVASRTKGIPFAEAVLAKFKTRPILAAAKSTSREGTKLHLVVCNQSKIGKEVIEEYDFPLNNTEHEKVIIASFAKDIVEKKGKVVLLSENFDKNLVLGKSSDGSVVFGDASVVDVEVKFPLEWFERSYANPRLSTEKGRIKKIPSSPLAKGITFGAFSLFVLMVMTRTEQQAEETAIKETEKHRAQFVNEFYDGYSPRVAMYQLYRTMVKNASERRESGLRNSVAGWKPTKIQLTSKSIMVNMKTDSNSPASNARNTAHKLGAGIVSLAQNEVLIVKEFNPDCSVPILKRPVLVPIEGTVNFVIGGLEKFLPNATVTFGKEKKKGEYAVRDIDIDVKNMSEESLDLLGVLLNDLPIGFKQGNFKIDGNFGLLSGKVQLQVIGCSLDNVTSTGLCK